MKRLFIYTFWLVGFIMLYPCHLSAASVYQHNDSVHRRIVSEGTLQLECYFTYRQGSSAIHKNLGNNAYELEKLERFIRSEVENRSVYVKRIRLTGYCSIEGNYGDNEQLARARAEGFRDYVHQNYRGLYRYPVDCAWVAEDWTKLASLVSASNLADKQEVLRIIREVGVFRGRELQLMKLNGGIPYRKMAKELFPLLRRVEITVEYDVAKMNEVLNNTTVEPIVEITIEEPTIEETAIEHSVKPEEIVAEIVWGEITEPVLQSRRRESERIEQHRLTLYDYSCRYNFPLLAVKTNLLSWGGITYEGKRTAFTPNLALEYFFSSSWAVEVGGSYAYWGYDNDRKFWGISGYRIEPRYWFSLPNLKHIAYLGAYARIGDYDIRDFEDDQATETINRTAGYWDAGLSGGFYLQLTPWLGLELGARAGYVHTNTALYTIQPPHAYLDRYDPYRKFRVTDLLLNIVYRFRR